MFDHNSQNVQWKLLVVSSLDIYFCKLVDCGGKTLNLHVVCILLCGTWYQEPCFPKSARIRRDGQKLGGLFYKYISIILSFSKGTEITQRGVWTSREMLFLKKIQECPDCPRNIFLFVTIVYYFIRQSKAANGSTMDKLCPINPKRFPKRRR